MVIVINHLTRMREGFFCAAGVDYRTHAHVRPLTHDGGSLGVNLLARHGGPFDMANMVRLGKTARCGLRPEVEDRRCDPVKAYVIRALEPTEFWELLRGLAKPSLAELFGPELECNGHSCTVDEGRGTASLGCLIPAAPPCLYLKQRPDRPPQLRMRLADGGADLDLGVTDIRLYEDDHVTPAVRKVRELRRRLDSSDGIVLSVGLTRLFAATPGREPVHWLQVNNIHLRETPSWALG